MVFCIIGVMLKKLFQNSVQFFQWYLGVWWRALIPLLFLGMVCIVCECLWSFLPSHRICDWISKLAFLLFLFFLLVNLVAGIFHFRRNYWKRGVAVWLLSLFVSLVVFVVLVGFMFLLGFMDVDHFADSLKLPEGITLSEPLPDGYRPFDDPLRAPDSSFQKQVLSAIGSGRKLAPDEVCRIPSLERLMSTPQGKEKLRNYLDASPEWTTRESSGHGFYATRNAYYEDGTIDISPFHHNFPATDVSTGEKDGIHSQYFFYISLDGKSWSSGESTESGCKTIISEAVKYSTWTWFKAGDAKVVIFDQTDFEGRQMTAKMLELAEEEFSKLTLPPMNEGEKPHFRLYNGMQGGMYIMDILCNPGEPGTLYIRANEITTGTKLSEKRILNRAVRIFGNEQPNELFPCKIDFTIYEGNWEQYYGAHIEVWFKPDSGGQDRKLFEDDYKVEGWMR